MAVSDSAARIAYNGAGLTGPFSIPFYFLANTHIQAVKLSAGVESTLTLTTHYTLTGAGNEDGGTLTLVTALAVGETLTIVRNVPLTQETNWPTADPFPADSHEDAADKLVMIAQQIADTTERTVRQPVSDPDSIGALPIATVRASKFLAFDADGDPIATSGSAGQPASTFMDTVLDDTSAAAARATLGSTTVGDAVFIAATAAAARAALVAAKSGAVIDSDITMTTARLLGRTTAATGAIEEISLAASLTLSGGSLSGTAASDSQAGVVELATNAELLTGTDSTRAVTPSNVASLRGYAKLASGTVSNQATADIVFAGAPYTTYDTIIILLRKVFPATDGALLHMRSSTDAGSTYDAGAGSYAQASVGFDDLDATAVEGDPSLTLLSLTPSFGATKGIGNAATEGCNAEIFIRDRKSAARFTQFEWNGSYITSLAATGAVRFTGAGCRQVAADVDAIRFLMSTGNVSLEYEVRGA